MAEDRTTRTDIGTSVSLEQWPDVPLLTIVYHPQPEVLGRRSVIPEDEPVVLGRASSQFGRDVLRDGLVSRQHVRILLDGDAVRAVDLDSRNGTFVNGERIDEQRLHPGDILGVGPALLLFHIGPTLPQPVRSDALIGVSHALGEVLAQAQRVATEPTAVLIQGETGVGKELVAREIHEHSGAKGPLIAVNCGALADGVVHSELFGHARGAFSGAGRERGGLIREAAGGSLFLDEIGDASPTLQASLLRLLEQGEYRQVGSDRVIRSDARFIAATHVPLEPAVEAGGFRRDLYGRLARWVIQVPPLRQRPEDIIPLALHFAREGTSGALRLRRSLALALLRYPWPNNVRELRATIERAVVESTDSEVLDPTGQLAEQLLAGAIVAPGAFTAERGRTSDPAEEDPSADDTPTADDRAGPAAPPEAKPPAPPRTPRPEAAELRAQLEALDCNVKALSAQLGISRRTAYRWLDEAGIDLRALRDEERS